MASQNKKKTTCRCSFRSYWEVHEKGLLCQIEKKIHTGGLCKAMF